jgi:hypothetical protein
VRFTSNEIFGRVKPPDQAGLDVGSALNRSTPVTCRGDRSARPVPVVVIHGVID